MTNYGSDHADLQDHIVLITGGTSGIGLATARLLLQLGAEVIITGRDGDRLASAAAQLNAAAGPAPLWPIRADAANLPDLDSLMAQIADRHGRLDGIFVNAGRLVRQGDWTRSTAADHGCSRAGSRCRSWRIWMSSSAASSITGVPATTVSITPLM